MTPEFNGIDHVHLNVSRRDQAADWYQQVLGFRVVAKLLFWATPAGPLTLEDSSGRIHLALFERPDAVACSALAFGASGEAFVHWHRHLRGYGLQVRMSDHKVSWSLYFYDPDNNQHEISTFDYDTVAAEMNRGEFS